MKTNNTFIIAIVILLCSQLTHAQDVSTYNDAWLLINNHIVLNSHWKIGNEIHWRSTQFLQQKEQFIIHPSLTYTASPNVSYTAGYSYIQSYPYGNSSIDITRPEHNTWQQVTLKQAINANKLQHRLRYEQRFIGHTAPSSGGYYISEYNFSHRFRYRFTVLRSINDRLFIHLFDEIWIRTDAKLDAPNYDRNWFYVGAGTPLDKHSNLQLGYLHQYNHLSSNQYEIHPTLQLTFQYDFL